MPANAASRSIRLPEEMTQNHTVLFLVYTKLVGDDANQLKPYLPDHLNFLKNLRQQGLLTLSGPFFTPEGQNSGDGMYVIAANSLEEAEGIASEDPMHRLGLRKPTVLPWAKDGN